MQHFNSAPVGLPVAMVSFINIVTFRASMVKYHGSSRGLPRTTHNVATRVTQVLQAHAAHSALLGKRSVHPPSPACHDKAPGACASV